MKLYVEYNLHKQNYLKHNGIYPIQEYNDICYFIKNKKLEQLLDRYYLERVIRRNGI